MPVHLLRAADRTATPWRNGGGVTREIAADPDGAWRVSLAEVAADGPFSVFPGLHRVLTVVDGPGLDLTVGDRPPVTVLPLHPFAFPGDQPTTGHLPGGPVTALNLMTRAPGATVRIVTGGGELRPEPGGAVIAVALDGYDAVLVSHPSTAPAPAGPVAVLALP